MPDGTPSRHKASAQTHIKPSLLYERIDAFTNSQFLFCACHTCARPILIISVSFHILTDDDRGESLTIESVSLDAYMSSILLGVYSADTKLLYARIYDQNLHRKASTQNTDWLPGLSNPPSDVPAVSPVGVPAFATLEGGPIWVAPPFYFKTPFRSSDTGVHEQVGDLT